jgi:hypothetical protein
MRDHIIESVCHSFIDQIGIIFWAITPVYVNRRVHPISDELRGDREWEK